MALKDFRDFIKVMESHGELQGVGEEVDWTLEMGAIIRPCYDIGAPAALFEKVKGHPAGFRALGASLGPSRQPGHSLYARIALAFGLAPDASPQAIMHFYLERKEKPVKPVTVRNGPCKANILLAKDVDLTKFHAPRNH